MWLCVRYCLHKTQLYNLPFPTNRCGRITQGILANWHEVVYGRHDPRYVVNLFCVYPQDYCCQSFSSWLFARVSPACNDLTVPSVTFAVQHLFFFSSFSQWTPLSTALCSTLALGGFDSRTQLFLKTCVNLLESKVHARCIIFFDGMRFCFFFLQTLVFLPLCF